MRTLFTLLLVITGIVIAPSSFGAEGSRSKDKALLDHEARMAWWREARFGMFVHWGLYAIPGEEWKGNPGHIDAMIRGFAQIPLEEYDKYTNRFNPVKFNADTWAGLARRAGMKYLVITSKHHEGFAMWDSKVSDFDVMATPFKRDILKEVSQACRKQDIRFCTYYSILDWHHPDYLPRRDWETSRSAEGADFNRYRSFLKSQLKEIVTGYNPGVLWFDGEWEQTWTHEMGSDLYDYVRGLNKKIIINNRVDKGRRDSAGQTLPGGYRGDFGTPEQEIPDQGLPGVDWESCMTMNCCWGWNARDNSWKSTEDLIRKLIDVVSKGGNLLLNVGPRADGTFPDQAVERLEGIGRWMGQNSEAIHGTQASPIGKPAWGRCTQKQLGRGKSRLYLHVFDWPKDGTLVVSGVAGKPLKAVMLDGGESLTFAQNANGLSLKVPAQPKNSIATVIAIDLANPKQ